MNAKLTPHQQTGLLRGQAATIARIHRVTRQHVVEVAAGRRVGNAKLMRTIAKYRARAAGEARESAA
jgi:hypothetical protein